MIKLSVIVPCYNVEQYIGECIDSILSQTLEDIELILVDDGSPDRSGEICDEYARKDKRVMVIHKKNAGVSAARNDGLAIASGEYVIFVDSDDYVTENGYDMMYKKAKEIDADIVIGDVIKIFPERQKYEQFFGDEFVTEDREFINKLVCGTLYSNFCPYPPSGGPAFGYGGPTNKIVRRALLDEYHIVFDERVKGIFDDIIYSAYITVCAKRIAYINTPVYYYRIVHNSITQSFKKILPQIGDEIIHSINEFMDKYNNGYIYNKAYNAFIIRVFAYCLPRYYCHKDNPSSTLKLSKELKTVLKSERYFSAANSVDLSCLTPGHRKLVALMRVKAALLIIITRKIMSRIKPKSAI